MITKVNFGKRISDLRIGGGQNSAREMSLALGQNPSYINRIENGKALPSMQGFFSICEYLQITPGDFFNEDSEAPREVRELMEKIEKLTPEQRIDYAEVLDCRLIAGDRGAYAAETVVNLHVPDCLSFIL